MISDIIRKLETGMNVFEVFKKAVPLAYRSYLDTFSQLLPFSNALSMSINLVRKDEELVKGLVGKLGYPFGLLGICFVGLWLFRTLCLPAFMEVITMMNTSTSTLDGFVLFTDVFSVVVTLMVLAFISGMAFFNYKPVAFYQLGLRIAEGNIFTLWYSYRFIMIFALCTDEGCSTWQTLAIMKRLEEQKVVCYLAHIMDEGLNKGNTLSVAFDQKLFDPRLGQLMKIAVLSGDVGSLLKGYLSVSYEQVNSKLKHFSQTIQAFVYAGIGVVLVMVYQVLLMPMQMISAL